jgi:tetratricopeptide (TPR) repeat protein
MFKSSWKSTFSALAVVAIFAAGVVGPQLAGAQENKVSNAVGKKLQEAMKLAGEKRVSEALAIAKEAQALAKGPYDTFKAYDVLAYVELKASDYPGALHAYEQIIDSQYLETANRAQYIKTMTQLYFQTKNYGKTIEFGQRWIKNFPGELDPIVLVGQAYFLQKDCKNAARFMDQAVEVSQSAGRAPKENFFLIKLQCATDAKSVAGQIDALQDLVARFPKKEYWSALLTLSNRDVPDNTTQHFYRLKFETDTLASVDEYVEMAQLAIQFGYPGEAQQVLERGFANKVLENDKGAERNRRLLESARKDAEGDKKTLPLQDKEARNQKTGETDVKLGFAYLTYADATHAVEALERGVGKGGVKSPAEAQIFLGMAYLKVKRSDEAKKAFRAAKDDQILGRVAKLWMIRADQT